MHDIITETTRPAVERYQPATREEWLTLRQRDITASGIAALLGLHPYCTAFDLWAEKTGKHVPVMDDNAVLRRGRLLEPIGVKLTAEELPQAKVKHNADNTYWRMPSLRIGATPDLLVEAERGIGTVQLKSIEPSLFKKTYNDGIPPLWIACQALTEAKLVGAQWAAVGVLRVGRIVEFDLFEVPLHQGMWQRLVEAVEAFWNSVERDTPPLPDYSRDGKLLAMLAGPSDGSTLDLSGDNELIHALHERERVKPLLDSMEFTVHSLDALIKHKMGAAEVAMAGDFRITLKTQEVAGYTVKPRTQRPLKIKRLRESVP